jgi:hypothetical protein
VYSLAELDKFGSDAKAQDDKLAHWWKVTVGTADGDSREGWVCDAGHNLVQKRSAWEWPGFKLIDNTSVPLLDSFKRFLYVQELLFDGDKESFEPSAMSVNGSELIQRLEKIVDRLGNKDGKVTAGELARAQTTRWVAQAMSHLVVRYESEWGGSLSKWESLSSLMKERKYIWQGELERIEKLQCWDKVKGVDGIPSDAAVYHFHPLGMLANFMAINVHPLDELIKKLGDVISLGEGSYESYNTGTHGPNGKVVHSFSDPPAGTITGQKIKDIIASASKSPDDTSRYFVSGKYQTAYYTLSDAVKRMGLSGEELYDPAMQERVFREFLIYHAGQGRLAAFIFKAQGTVFDAQLAAAQEWASIAAPTGAKIKDGRISDGTLSYYERAKQNHASMKSTERVVAVLEEINRSR